VRDDPASAFPRAYSGAVEIELRDGRVLARREVNRGHDERPLSNADIVAKFEQSMARVADGPAARRVLESVLALGDDRPAAGFAESCRA
jgi:2-methylcitrate dehydratase PrpD